MSYTRIYTDHALMEISQHGTRAFPFRYYYEDINQFDRGRVARHWHKEFEFVLVARGGVEFRVGNSVFTVKEGNGVFINTGIIHEMRSVGEGIIPNFLFDGTMIAAADTAIYEKYVGCFFHSGISHLELDKNERWQKNALERIERVCDLGQEGTEAHQLEIHIAVCSLWKLLYDHQEEMIRTEQTGISAQSQIRLGLMLDFIQEHYARRITLEEVASAASVSKSEAIRCFQAGMSLSPMNAVNEYRLARAREQLLTTMDSVTDIAQRVGFENCSYFDRMFRKKYGITPREMRK